MSRGTRSRGLGTREIAALLDVPSDEEENINELYSQDELQDAAAPPAPPATEAGAGAEVEDDFDFELSGRR